MFNVIIDTREKIPWDMASVCSSIDNVIIHKLDTGDYAIEGLEHTLCIERKKSICPIGRN